ncbi:hypothetical protein GCM10017674_81420 [Streptomyces gardneri]|uniref:Uncharacterized protein n=1 Tax=Streptomyces gardneri TaxID=66892 RepID=A0A4Y3RCG9_9ACTN|nr:hypothetical protein SGA01_00020 [Streptomyces gardneri]GHH24182.1 hypothetical protein GCM10017674_81420 [Streptomyces gardneri]
MGHKPLAVPDTEVLFLGQSGKAGRGNTEGIGAAAENLVPVRFRVPGEPHYGRCGRDGFSGIPT